MTIGDEVIQNYLDDKFLGNGSDRFKDERGEYHASAVTRCPRRWKWQFKRGTPDESSPYFELGNLYEDIYGRALRTKYGSDRVVQDVNCEIHFGDFSITGESDWCILPEGPEFVPDKVEHWPKEDRPRRVETDRGHVLEQDDTGIDHVIETKTIGNADWVGKYGVKTKYSYQCRTYMWAFGVDGVVAYMERDDLSEVVVELERDSIIESDIEVRCIIHHRNLGEDVPGRATPEEDKECDWCHFQDECEEIGGERWDDV